MGMSNAERQRKFRMKRDADAQRRQMYLENEKEKYRKDKATGLKKQVKDMTEREKRAARKRWRNQKRKMKAKANALKNALTPPETPEIPAVAVLPTSRQKKQSTKKKNREITKCYRQNKVLQQHIVKLKRQAEMYKKRWLRQKNKNPETPRTKTRKLLRYFPRKEVKKTLIFHNALIDQIRKHYKKEKKMEKIRLARMVSGPVLRKYKFKTHAFKVLEVATRIPKYKPKKNTLFHRLCQCVTNFYLRDNSRVMTGLKNTVTFKKNKKQRRILNDSLKNLHLKYLSEYNPNLSYTLFCRLRPFWVVFPTERDRNTCLCKLCENCCSPWR